MTRGGAAFSSVFQSMAVSADPSHPYITVAVTNDPGILAQRELQSDFWHRCQNKSRRPEWAGLITFDFSMISGATRRDRTGDLLTDCQQIPGPVGAELGA